MPQCLTLSRAAHLLGITRAQLQEQIRRGDLASFDGMISAEEILRAWPEFSLDDSRAFEKTRAIREDAFAKRLRERLLPTQEVLAQRLFAQSRELTELRRVLTRYHDLFESLSERLSVSTGPEAADLSRLLDAGLATALSAPAPQADLMALDAMLGVMSSHVTLKPSGRDFFVEGSETLLKAALRSGLSPNYGCGNGNCGLCKARVVEGETRMMAPSDYRFSDVEKAQGHVLMCACTAVSSDLVLEVLEANAAEDIPEQQLVAKVRSIEPMGDDVLRLHLQTPRTNRLRFLAGQRVTLGLANSESGGDAHAEYAIASCPCDDRNLIFHIRRDASADFSLRLADGRVKAGSDVSVWGPWGDFVLDKDAHKPLIFAAIDTGFAPINSLVEHAMAVDMDESMTLYWASTKPGAPYGANQARAWSEALDNFRYEPLPRAELAARICADPALAQSIVYLAGDADGVSSVGELLLAAGLPPEQLHVEAL